MRLVDPNQDTETSSGTSSAEGQPQQQVRPVTQRDRSSLDYKASNRSSKQMLTTKPGKRKNHQQQQQEYEQQQQQQQQEQVYHRRVPQTRSRGSSGPPKAKWGLSDLSNMNEEQLMEALYSNPELAEEAVRMAEQMEEKKSKPKTAPTPKPKRSRTSSSRTKKNPAEFSEYPDHMRDKMDGGVPVMEWVVLLALVALALYQLRKMTMLPDTKKTSKQRGQTKKGKKKSAKTSRGSSPSEATTNNLTVEEAVRALGLDDGEKTSTAANKRPKSAPTKKKKKLKIPTSKKKQEKSQPDLVSTDGSTGAAPEDPTSSNATVNLAAPMNNAITVVGDEGNNGDGWQTVGKNRNSSETPTPATLNTTEVSQANKVAGTEALTAPAEVDQKTPATTVPSKPEVVGDTTTTPATESNSDEWSTVGTKPSAKTNNVADTKPSQTSKKSKTKKKKVTSDQPKKEAAIAVRTNPGSDKDDEAMARRLQTEEENRAHQQNGTTNLDDDEIWEEVATRKRKGNKTVAAA